MSSFAFLALTAAALALPAPGPAELRAEIAAACRLPAQELGGADLVGYARLLAGARPNGICRRDPALALRVARAVAETPGPGSGEAYWLLSLLHSGGQGVRKDSRLSLLYRRRAWLLGAGPTDSFESAAEAEAYFTDAESIAFLRERVARGSPPGERVRLAEALLARRAAGDLAEARTLLRTPGTAAAPSAPVVLAKAALEPGATPADVAKAAAGLRPAGPSGGREVRALILRLARLQLASARTPEDRWDAVESLAAAAYSSEAEPLAEFRQALSAANGGLEPATVDAAIPRLRIDAQDYPASALREGVSGMVRLRALVDPRGRMIFTESVDPSQPVVLVESVRRMFARRAVPATAVPRPTPYVWIAVPPAAFRLVR